MLLSVLTVFGEELGWRGFLQDALRPLHPAARYIMIGVLWETWHFTNRTQSGWVSELVMRLLLWFPMCIALSWLVGEAVERSRSLLVAHTLHVWINLAIELPWIQAKVALAVSVVVWTQLLLTWSPDAWRP
jgi:membrane protease YdiL (CAAX protease family)